MSQSLAKNLIHLIFSTKRREGLLKEELRPSLHRYMSVVLKNLNCPAVKINSVDDHVHVLFLLHRTSALSDVVRALKTASSKWIKANSSELSGFAWQSGYGAFSVSESNVGLVVEYIEKQEEHHQTVSFKSEFVRFLDAHGIKYDATYVWE